MTEALAQEPNARVIIALRTDLSPNAADVASLKVEISAKQGSVLSALTAPDFIVTRLYDAVPAIAGRITPAALAILANHPDVAAIENDGTVHAILG